MSFLSNLLPTIVGAGVGAVTMNPMAGAAAAGALGYAQSGSLQKGLMAGLAGYGGASLAGGLSAAGETAFSNEALKNAGANLSAEEAMAVQQKAAQEFAQKNAFDKLGTGIGGLSSTAGQQAFMADVGGTPGLLTKGLAAASPMLMATNQQPTQPVGDSTMPQRLKYEQGTATPFPQPDVPDYGNLGQDFGRQRNYFPGAGYKQITPEEAKSIRGYAAGGYMGGGPVEQMSNANAVGMNTGYPQADITGHAYATPWQTPVSQNVVQDTADTGVNRMTGDMLADGGAVDPTPDFEQPYTAMARGGLSDLGSYSDGGRLLRGPGDGVSDSIPAVIGKKRPARLADGEFVVPARIVSELGNGSTEAGARKLYAMLDRVQSARKKSIGKDKVAHNSRADKYLPA